MEEAEKKEKKFYKKWWFWLIILICVVVVAFTSIMIVAIGKVTSGVSGIAIEIQKIYKDATLYSSAGDRELILQIPNFEDIKNTDQSMQMMNIIKSNAREKLSNYEKVIIFSYLKSDEKQIVIDTYSLPDFTLQEHNTYIKFEEYEKLYNTLEQTTDSYSRLFNSIH